MTNEELPTTGRVIKELKCLACGYEWFPRAPDETPVICPSCKSSAWAVGPVQSTDNEDIEGEENVVWVHPPELFPYVREAWAIRAGRRRSISLGEKDGRILVGYTTLGPNAEALGEGRYYRRFFYVMPHDRCFTPDGTYSTGTPEEGIDPLTVAPNIKGKDTDRAWTESPTPEQQIQLKAIFEAQQKKIRRR